MAWPQTIFHSCDPEVVVLDGNGKPAAAHRWFPPKSEELKTPERGSRFRDGFNLEINADPRHCRGLVIDNTYTQFLEALRALPDGYSLGFYSAYPVQNEDFEGAPEDVMRAGCSPSLDAYTGRVHHPRGFLNPERYCGGHLHFSVQRNAEKEHPLADDSKHELLVKMWDLYVGAPIHFALEDEGARRRRGMYGRAGDYRIQQYPSNYYTESHPCDGLEYRTPGPEIWSQRGFASLAMGVCRKIIQNFEVFQAAWDASMEGHIQSYINGESEDGDFLKKLRVEEYYDWEILQRLRDYAHKYRISRFTKNEPQLTRLINPSYPKGFRDNWEIGWNELRRSAEFFGK